MLTTQPPSTNIIGHFLGHDSRSEGKDSLTTTVTMGKAGRFACIIVPFLLTLASLLCIILTFAAGQDKGKPSTLSNLYFMKVRHHQIPPPFRPLMLTIA